MSSVKDDTVQGGAWIIIVRVIFSISLRFSLTLMPPLVSSDEPTDLSERRVSVKVSQPRRIAMRNLGGPLLERSIDEAEIGVVFQLHHKQGSGLARAANAGDRIG